MATKGTVLVSIYKLMTKPLASVFAGESWHAWKTLLRACFEGIDGLTDAERDQTVTIARPGEMTPASVSADVMRLQTVMETLRLSLWACWQCPIKDDDRSADMGALYALAAEARGLIFNTAGELLTSRLKW
jgi:hypothetical protein